MIILSFDTEEEREKFIVLYETYKKIIYYTIKRFVNDEYRIEDLSQEIYIIISEHLDDIDMKNPKRTQNYIITITRNYCKNYLRKQNRTPETLFDEFSEMGVYSEDIIEKFINEEQIIKLAEAVGQLEDIYKVVLELKYINNFNDDQIAAFLKVKKKTVQMRLYRAKKVLRNNLEER